MKMKSKEEIKHRIGEIENWMKTAEDLPDVTNKHKWEVVIRYLDWVLTKT